MMSEHVTGLVFYIFNWIGSCLVLPLVIPLLLGVAGRNRGQMVATNACLFMYTHLTVPQLPAVLTVYVWDITVQHLVP